MVELTPPKFVIASPGRSGTGYVSKVLKKAGIDCGHQDWFISPGRGEVTPRSGMDGDSSCFSLEHLSKYEGFVFQQARDPLKVITSHYVCRQKIIDVPAVLAFKKNIADCRHDPQGLEFWMAYVYKANEIANQRAGMFWRVEDFGTHCIAAINGMLGRKTNRHQAHYAVQRVVNNFNQHHLAPTLGWADLPECDLKDKLIMQANGYGYEY